MYTHCHPATTTAANMDEIALEILDFVKVKGSLKTHVMRERIVSTIADRLKAGIPAIATLAKDLELLKLICTCVENCVDKKMAAQGLDKKEIALSIVKSCFPLMSESDQVVVAGQIDMLCFNGLIRKVALRKRLWRWLTSPKKKD